VTNIRKNI